VVLPPAELPSISATAAANASSTVLAAFRLVPARAAARPLPRVHAS
jgi:hypothetical protein